MLPIALPLNTPLSVLHVDESRVAFQAGDRVAEAPTLRRELAQLGAPLAERRIADPGLAAHVSGRQSGRMLLQHLDDLLCSCAAVAVVSLLAHRIQADVLVIAFVSVAWEWLCSDDRSCSSTIVE